jgi:adenine-specific DNA-methyltransferase
MRRLEYIGCKYQLAPWIEEAVLAVTGQPSMANVDFVDACCGTGVVTYHMRKAGANVYSIDTEMYAAIIGHAVARSAATPTCLKLIARINGAHEDAALSDQMAALSVETAGLSVETVGLIEREYSEPRMFFTRENARKIDAARVAIAKARDNLTEDEHAFMVASLIVSADAVSNTTSVYGAFLKKYKAASLRPFELVPIHDFTEVAKKGRATKGDVLDPSLYAAGAHVFYFDPPYNERQYSKNYFPLNAVACDPSRDAMFAVKAHTKTGIPEDCYLSPFCRKAEAASAFRALLRAVPSTSHVVVSYSSEGIVGKDEMVAILGEHGEVTVRSREHKRFASATYNDPNKKVTTEYLFCVKRLPPASAEPTKPLKAKKAK